MANPEVIELPKGEWTLVAQAVTRGQIHILEYEPNYYHTYRISGEDAPTEQPMATDPPMYRRSIPIIHSEPIDVYLYVKTADGKVRVDL